MLIFYCRQKVKITALTLLTGFDKIYLMMREMNAKRRKIVIISLSVLLFAVIVTGAVLLGIYLYNPALDEPIRIVAYFTSASVNEDTDLSVYDFDHVTHVIYAFAHIDGTTSDIYVENAEGLKKLSKYLATNVPSVKLMLSIATSWDNDGMCRASHTKSSRANIVEQCSRLMTEYNLNGFDIDWEYPTYNLTNAPYCKDCASDHASLIEDLRHGLPSDTILSFAGTNNYALASALKNNRLKNIVDFVNVMLYDMRMRKHSALNNCKSSIYAYQLMGYSKNQLNFGLPFYGRCEDPQFDYLTYAQIVELIDRGDASLVQKKNYSHALYGNALISFDTTAQIKKKADYVKKRGYGGVFCWHLSCDKNNELTNLLWQTLRG